MSPVAAATAGELRIGTRASALAVRQAESVAAALRAAWPSLSCRLVTITTTGDRDLDRPIPAFGGKGVFTIELEAALVEGAVDLAVHSLKDLPTATHPAIVVGAVTRREDARDALVSRDARSLADLPTGARIGTSSLRRSAQLRAARPDVRPESIRGNLDTRLRKLDEGLFDALVLACAGLRRLGLEGRLTQTLPFEVMLPAPGQGALAVQRRADDDRVAEMLSAVHDPETWSAVSAERAFLSALGAGCSAPVAAYAELRGRVLRMEGLVAAVDGTAVWRVESTGDPRSPDELGERLAADVQRRAAAATAPAAP